MVFGLTAFMALAAVRGWDKQSLTVAGLIGIVISGGLPSLLWFSV